MCRMNLSDFYSSRRMESNYYQALNELKYDKPITKLEECRGKRTMNYNYLFSGWSGYENSCLSNIRCNMEKDNTELEADVGVTTPEPSSVFTSHNFSNVEGKEQ